MYVLPDNGLKKEIQTYSLPTKLITQLDLSSYYTWEKVKFAYNNKKSKISASTWNDEFDLPDGSYSFFRYSRLFLGHY